jgi:hypothetical protein|nr:MAG TPA: hypothetical protein [Caudoviricetes sp.]
MNNPFMAALGGGQMPGPMGELMQLKQKFQQFQSGFQGNPKEEVNKLLQSGAMSQQELNQLQTMAKQFEHLFH